MQFPEGLENTPYRHMSCLFFHGTFLIIWIAICGGWSYSPSCRLGNARKDYVHQSDDNKWGTVFFTDPDFLFNSALNVLWAASSNVRKTKITTLYYPILSYLSYSILIQHQKRALMISPFMAKLATNPKGFALSQQLSQGDYKWAPESHPLPWKINMLGSNGLFDPKHYTPGPWLLRISVVRFSLVRIFKK